MSYQLITDGLRITQGPNLTTALPSTFLLDAADGAANIFNQNYVAGWKKETLGWVRQEGTWKPGATFMRESDVQKRTQLYINNPSSVALVKSTVNLVTGNATFTFANAIGMSAYGGVISYILQPGDPGYTPTSIKGLILGPSFGGTFKITENGQQGIKDQAIGTGEANTIAWIASLGNTGSYATKNCRDLTTGGYTDWFLPSFDEMTKIFISRDITGGVPFTWCWTSSESPFTQQIWSIFVPSYVPGVSGFGGLNAVNSSISYVACRYFTE